MLNIAEWRELAVKLKVIKSKEATMRREICGVLMADQDISSGRATVKTHLEGFNLKAVQTLSYSLDKAALGSVWNSLSEVEKSAIKMVPEIKLKEYKALPADSLLHEAITSKPAMPTLEATVPEE